MTESWSSTMLLNDDDIWRSGRTYGGEIWFLHSPSTPDMADQTSKHSVLSQKPVA